MTIAPITARWASGAEASKADLRICAPRPNRNFLYDFTFLRPTGVPGQEFDARFALGLERNAILQQQEQAQESANVIQALGVIQQQNAVKQAINCVSQQVGNTLQTTCH